VLRDFVHEYRGKRASTEDFRRILERDAPGDWGWFFDAWIYGAEIPTLTWSYRVEPAESSYRISVTVKRSRTSDDFSIIAPIRVELDGNRHVMVLVPVKKAEQTVTRILPGPPRNVIFAPNHSLLANVRRE
jgi:aminopeptidase N